MSEALRTRLAEVKPDDPAGRTFAEVVAGNLIEIACSEGPWAVHAATEIGDRLEGRAAVVLTNPQSWNRYGCCGRDAEYNLALPQAMACGLLKRTVEVPFAGPTQAFANAGEGICARIRSPSVNHRRVA